MIRLNCTKCKSELLIDDAFAGGVCRCQHCGTIQTVPKRLKGSAAGTIVETPKPKTRGPRQAGPELPISSGLDDLAHAVASTGLSSGGLRSQGDVSIQADPIPSALPAPPPARNRLSMILLAIGLIIIALLSVVIVLLVRHR